MLNISLGTHTKISTYIDSNHHQKHVNSKELFALMEAGRVIETGLLPPNTRYYVKSTNSISLAVEFLPARKTILVKHDGSNAIQTIENTPLPGGMFMFNLRPGSDGIYNIAKLAIWALPANGLTNMTDLLYQYPTPNTEASGRMCWGHDAKVYSGLKKVSALEGVIRAFFRTHFNDHLWYRDCISHKFPWDESVPFRQVEIYFKMLVELGEFKDEWLRATPYTFEKAFRDLEVC